MTDQTHAVTDYTSPLMSRLAGSGRLTLEDLARDVPIFQNGRRAEAALAEGTRLTAARRRTLIRERLDGDAARDRLVLSALPLIKMLAQKEYRRRRNWQSSVGFDDLMQEGVSGLIRGLVAYRVDGSQKSPTNYLGQWIVTEMRRNSEAADNDFGVAFDAAERFRRIRALRARLSSDLGREPTDAEIIEASVDVTYTGGKRMGRVNKTTTVRPLTAAQIAEERDMRTRVGITSRLVEGGTEDSEGPLIDFAQPLHDTTEADETASTVVDQFAKQALTDILDRTLNLMGIPDVQREIISRRYGLAPYRAEQSARDISRSLGLHRERVGKVIDAFSTEMTRSGGAFQRVCSSITPEELADLGLGWVTAALRTAPTPPAPDVAEILRIDMTPRARPPAVILTAGRPGPVKAEFVCPVHKWPFCGAYLSADDVPATRECPSCARPSPLTRLMEQQ